jgi:hypothetical protein
LTTATHEQLKAYKRQLRWEQRQGEIEAEARRTVDRYAGWELSRIAPPRYVAVRDVYHEHRRAGFVSRTRSYASGQTLKSLERELVWWAQRDAANERRLQRQQAERERSSRTDNNTTEETT